MNRLADETSPYLRQHKDNPVDWYPWGPEAFAEAKRRDRPVLLSIGYSACHWCHVMAHESFEDPAIAKQMNRTFVNIKVDREERPDVDAIYMDAVQALTGRGGWPLTAILTPDAEPFFGATYIPAPSFLSLMDQIDGAWKNNRPGLLEHAGELTKALQAVTDRKPAKNLPAAEVVDRGAVSLHQSHDASFGGFGGAPKFPQAMNIDALLRHHRRTGDADSLDVAMHTLKAMISGGIYDHIGGGFARYSVDERWDIPHFEKMLYDQALISSALLHAWKLTHDPDIEMALEETIAYVLRDLTNSEGGFCSAEDADADGVEGSFTVFTPREIEGILGEDAEQFCAWFNITAQGNFEGASNPRRPPQATIVRSPEMESLRARVFAARELRVKPGLDDKVILEWNALMLTTLAEAAAAFENDAWLDAAQRNAEFLQANLRDSSGAWHRSWAQGRAQHTPVAADMAALADAFTRLYEASGEVRWLAEAAAVASLLVDEYSDPEFGGFFTTANSAEPLIARSKDLMDNATPGANSLAAVALIRLASLADRGDFREEAIRAIRLVAEPIHQHPTAFGHMLEAVTLAHEPPAELVITGDRPDLLEVAQSGLHPDIVLSWGDRIPGSPLWDYRDDGLAYVCRDYVCKAPVGTMEELQDLLP